MQSDTQSILDLTASLVGDGAATPEIRFMRAQALAFAGDQSGPPANRERWLEADGLLGEVIVDLHDAHPLLAPAFVVRSEVRARLGRDGDAGSDLHEAERVNRDDPSVIEQMAVLRASHDDFHGALRILTSRVVDEVPSLVALRADVNLGLGNRSEAEADLRAAVAALSTGPETDAVRLRLASTALHVGDVALATSLQAQVSDTGRASGAASVVSGQLAFQRGDPDAGRAFYHQAIAATRTIACHY